MISCRSCFMVVYISFHGCSFYKVIKGCFCFGCFLGQQGEWLYFATSQLAKTVNRSEFSV